MPKARSVRKNIRKSAHRRKVNIIKKKVLKNAMKGWKKIKTKKKALTAYAEVQALIDKSVKDGIISKNKAARLKSHLIKHLTGKK